MEYWDDWYDRPEPRLKREIFLYARTRFAVEFADEAIEALAKVYQYRVGLLEIGRNREVWNNGFVLRLTTHKGEGPIDLSEIMGPGLKKLDAWAMHDGRGEHIESDQGGPFTRYFEAAPSHDISQVFIMGDPNNRRYNDRIESVRSQIKSLCLPVFYFENGQIMFLNTKESGSITNQRCGSEIYRFDGWCVMDSRGEAFSPDGLTNRAWSRLYLGELSFGGSG